MVNKTKATPQKEEAREKGPETPDAPLPLPDLSDAAVKKIIKQAKTRGYVTPEQLNAVMPSEEVTSEQIEDILAALNEMGIIYKKSSIHLALRDAFRKMRTAAAGWRVRFVGCCGRNPYRPWRPSIDTLAGAP